MNYSHRIVFVCFQEYDQCRKKHEKLKKKCLMKIVQETTKKSVFLLKLSCLTYQNNVKNFVTPLHS